MAPKIDTDLTVEAFAQRAIGIDTEYRTDKTGAIDAVYCVCATDAQGHTFKRWLHQGERRPAVLSEIADRMGIERPIFVAHAYDIAERQALLHIGADPYQYPWLCTHHCARVCTNAFVVPSKRPAQSLSYASLCKTLLGIDIDTVHKSEMRELCITGRVDGYEREILDYCLSDTQYLIPLAMKLVEIYAERLSKALCVFGSVARATPLGLLLYQSHMYSLFGEIADRGIPVSTERTQWARKGAVEMTARLYKEFNYKYHGTYRYVEPKPSILEEVLGADFVERLKQDDADAWRDVKDELKQAFDGKRGLKRAMTELDKISAQAELCVYRSVSTVPWAKVGDSGWHRVEAMVQERLQADIDSKGLTDYPRTASGKLSTAMDTLSEYFRTAEGFGHDLYRLLRTASQLKGVACGWTDTLRCGRLKYRSLRPFASATGRCQPKTSLGFLMGWSKCFYGLLEPPQGKWLVELDFTSEETGIQAILCDDPAYKEAYGQKDIYMWMGAKMGLIPQADYDTLSKGELKEKYGDIRTKLKTFVLAWSYGCGATKLASRAGISQENAKAIKRALEDQIFAVSTTWKKRLIGGGEYRGMVAKDMERLKPWSKTYPYICTPDGWLCRTASYKGETRKSEVSILNWPFQSFGAYILRRLVIALDRIESIELVATVHDAVLFLVDEGDNESISLVKDTMARVANESLRVQDFIKVGEPDIIKFGDIWTPDPDGTALFNELIVAGMEPAERELWNLGDACLEELEELEAQAKLEAENAKPDSYKPSELKTSVFDNLSVLNWSEIDLSLLDDDEFTPPPRDYCDDDGLPLSDDEYPPEIFEF